MPLGLLTSLLGGGSSSSQENTADEIFAGITRDQLDRYNTEQRPLEELYAEHLIGPQAEQNRSNLLQSVSQQTDSAFGRARSRMQERNRMQGRDGIDANDNRRLQNHQQLSKAQNVDGASRYFDRLRTDLL